MEIDQERNERNKKLLYDLSNKLKEREYAIAEPLSSKRIEFPLPSIDGVYESIGVLAKKHLILFGFNLSFIRGRRMCYPGEIWIDNAIRGAEPDRKWILDVYGIHNVAPFQKLIEQLAKPYGVKIESRVSINQTRLEDQALYWPSLENQIR